jgi:glucose/mannose-6-phosphate isomerase
MLDNIYDKSDMKHVLEGFSQQIKEAYAIPVNIKLKGKPSMIIICGMGGSSISGQILDSYLKMKKFTIPIINVASYDVPAFADSNALFLINSYSGNTEETISCLRQAMKINNNIIIIASGGKLIELAQSAKLPYIQIPKGLQPRNAVAYLFFPLLTLLENNQLIEPQASHVNNLINALQKNTKTYASHAAELAKQIDGKVPIIYSSEIFYPVAYRWKSEFNENTKIMSYCNKFPELNHNELNGFLNKNVVKINFHIIMLKEEYDHKRIIKRMSITKKLIKEMNDQATFTEINIKGPDALTRIFTTIHVGDLISYYLAINYATDPTPVDIIERFKKEMGPNI